MDIVHQAAIALLIVAFAIRVRIDYLISRLIRTKARIMEKDLRVQASTGIVPEPIKEQAAEQQLPAEVVEAEVVAVEKGVA